MVLATQKPDLAGAIQAGQQETAPNSYVTTTALGMARALKESARVRTVTPATAAASFLASTLAPGTAPAPTAPARATTCGLAMTARCTQATSSNALATAQGEGRA
jgi:hypothetical protein